MKKVLNIYMAHKFTLIGAALVILLVYPVVFAVAQIAKLLLFLLVVSCSDLLYKSSKSEYRVAYFILPILAFIM